MQNPYPQTTYRQTEIEASHLSKMTFIEKHTNFISLGVFDYALPQGWLDSFVAHHDLNYSQVLFSTVWLYPPGHSCGLPISFNTQVQAAINSDNF